MSNIMPEPTPNDPAAAALDLLTELPGIAGAPAESGLLAVFQDLAGIMQLEGILEGMDWNDARGTVAALGVDLMYDDPDKLLSRAAWIRSTAEGSHPLHEPERVAVALERVHAIMGQPIAGPML
jgi:hypothetical protein